MHALKIIFVLSLFMILYIYAGYFIALKLFSVLIPRRRLTENKPGELPQVAVLIAAYNEENSILNKIENILSSNYPADKLSVYVVSDASRDRTNELVASYGHKNVHLIASPERRGKTVAENIALEQINKELIVFTDAAVMLGKKCIQNLVRHFQYNEVGCVSSRDESIQSETGKGENLYVKYEMAVRSLESKFCSLVGLSGSCYASRRELCTKLPGYATRDFALPLIAMEKGYISIDDPEAVCSVKVTEDVQKEFVRKIRTFTNGIYTLFYKRNLLNIFQYGRFSFILWSHKLFRWLLPFFFITLFFANIPLFPDHAIYKITFILQIVFYCMALWGRTTRSDRLPAKLLRISHYLCMTNIASIAAWYNFFVGNPWTKWEPTVRKKDNEI